MPEVDPFAMIDELSDRSSGVLYPPIKWGRVVLGVIVGMLSTPWVLGGLSWVKHHVGPAIKAYGEWAYRLAGGQ